jgi:hypothetical protein
MKQTMFMMLLRRSKMMTRRLVKMEVITDCDNSFKGLEADQSLPGEDFWIEQLN